MYTCGVKLYILAYAIIVYMSLSVWIRGRQARRSFKDAKGLIKLIEGGLLKYRGKVTSVELQHETKKKWIKESDVS